MKNHNLYWKNYLLACFFFLAPHLLSAQCWQDQLPDQGNWVAVLVSYSYELRTKHEKDFFGTGAPSGYAANFTDKSWSENIQVTELGIVNGEQRLSLRCDYRDTRTYDGDFYCNGSPAELDRITYPTRPSDCTWAREDNIGFNGSSINYISSNNGPGQGVGSCNNLGGGYAFRYERLGNSNKNNHLSTIEDFLYPLGDRSGSSDICYGNQTNTITIKWGYKLVGILTQNGFIPALDDNQEGIENLDCEESCEYTSPPSLPANNRKCFQYRKDGQLKTVCVTDRGTLVDFKYDEGSGKHDISLRKGITSQPCLIADDVDLLESGTCVNSGTNNLSNNDVVCESCRPLSRAPNCIAIRDQCGFTSYRCGFLGEGYFGAVKSSEMSVEIDSDPNQNDVQRVALTYSDGFEQEIYREQVQGSDWNKMALISQGYTNLTRCLDAPLVVGPTDGFRDLNRYPAARPNYSSASENMKCRTRLERGQAVETVCNSCSGLKKLFFSVANNFKVSFEAKPGENSPVKISAEITGENFTESFAAGCTERVYDGFADCNSPSSNLTPTQEETTRIQEVLDSELNRSQLDERIKVYPNPTNNSFKIAFNLSNQESISYKITDFQGRTIGKSSITSPAQKGSNTLLISDLSQAPKGVYLLRLDLGSQGIHTQRIVKM